MAADIFAKIGDIKGESLDSKHKDEVELLSISWSITNMGNMSQGSGGGSGKAQFGDMTFNHAVDKASPVLQQACATGEHFKEATITHRKAGKTQQEFLIYKLTDVIVTGVQQSAMGGGMPGNSHTESVSLQFAKVAVEYKPQKADGSLEAGVHFKYDIKGNVKL